MVGQGDPKRERGAMDGGDQLIEAGFMPLPLLPRAT